MTLKINANRRKGAYEKLIDGYIACHQECQIESSPGWGAIVWGQITGAIDSGAFFQMPLPTPRQRIRLKFRIG